MYKDKEKKRAYQRRWSAEKRRKTGILERKVHFENRRKYDWAEIQKYYDEGNGRGVCKEKFGFANHSWDKAVYRGDIKPRLQIKPLDEFLKRNCYKGNKTSSRGGIKARLLREGILKNECYECKLPTIWNEKYLVLVLDHKDGDKYNYEISNLRMLCPNCNSQADTFAGRNVKRLKLIRGVVG